MPDNKKRTPATPGLLARLSKIVGLNIGTIMFGVLFLYMAIQCDPLYDNSLILNLIRLHPDLYPEMKPIRDLQSGRNLSIQRILPDILPIMPEKAVRSMQTGLYMVSAARRQHRVLLS